MNENDNKESLYLSLWENETELKASAVLSELDNGNKADWNNSINNEIDFSIRQ